MLNENLQGSTVTVRLLAAAANPVQKGSSGRGYGLGVSPQVEYGLAWRSAPFCSLIRVLFLEVRAGGRMQGSAD
jgi:hypothetical protein